jgi:hypothetical protein
VAGGREVEDGEPPEAEGKGKRLETSDQAEIFDTGALHDIHKQIALVVRAAMPERLRHSLDQAGIYGPTGSLSPQARDSAHRSTLLKLAA